jgi:hypothetical protein
MSRSHGVLLLASVAGWAGCGHDYGSFMLEAADATVEAVGAGGVTGPAEAGVAGTGGTTGPAAGGSAGAGGTSAVGGSPAGTCGPGLFWCNGSCLSRLNPTNCGGCNNNCTAQGLECIDGVCGCRRSNECGSRPGATCDTTATRCSCGSSCSAGETCGTSSGCSCNGGAACATGLTCCQTPSGCRDLASDANNCGGCDFVCPTGQRCVQGACT